MNDVPRNANGWPTVGPEFFTLNQLITEAQNWINAAEHSGESVGRANWFKYTDELIRREYMTQIHREHWARTKKCPNIYKLDGKWVVDFIYKV